MLSMTSEIISAPPGSENLSISATTPEKPVAFLSLIILMPNLSLSVVIELLGPYIGSTLRQIILILQKFHNE